MISSFFFNQHEGSVYLDILSYERGNIKYQENFQA